MARAPRDQDLTTTTQPHALPALLDGVERDALIERGAVPDNATAFVEAVAADVEAFILDFSREIYGRPLRLDFLERLRGEKRFDSVDALVEQMRRDVEEARRIAA